MTESGPRSRERGWLSSHILPASGTMIGVAATLIGLVKIAEARIGPSHVDEFAALTTLPFLVSAIASYISMRHERNAKLSARCELLADQTFLVGLVSIAVVAVFFAYEVI
ncbi:MAG: hypothetical protein J0G95_08680 [Rhizobiales bacterium]|nr:hypothetical protein [Hyphomicrobiales bacterium]